MSENHEYKIGNMTIESNISKEEAADLAKTKLREAAKDAAVSAVKLGQRALDGTKKAAKEVEQKINDAKPAVDKAVEEVKAFIDEVKEEVKKEDSEPESKEENAAGGSDNT